MHATPLPSQSSPPSDAALQPGTLVAQRYRIDSVLGEGGMGVVYLAEHVAMRKTVALKVLHVHAQSPEMSARFEREAIAAANIGHENVAGATDFGQLDGGSLFLVLEYVDGRSLRHELEGGALSADRALRIVRAMGAGVAAAHAKGIVHRDLKPENVMLCERLGNPDFVKVLDFGIAKLDETIASSDAQPLTAFGTVIGTPSYMSPEQSGGQAIDARSDLYALGIILYELLTGECPFEGDPMTVLQHHVNTPAPPLPDAVLARVGDDVGALIAELLVKEPAARVQSADELVRRLDSLERKLPEAGAVLPLAPARPTEPGLQPAAPPVADATPDPSAPTAFARPTPVALAPTTALPAPTKTERQAAAGPVAERTTVQSSACSLADWVWPRAQTPLRRQSMMVAGAVLLVLAVALSLGARDSKADEGTPAAAAGETASTDDEPADEAEPENAPATDEAPEPTADKDPPAGAETSAAAATPAASSSGGGGGKSKSSTSSSSTNKKKTGRKTGPGGIYIPPPSKWLN